MDDFKISMRAARVNANKTQAELAEALHVGKQTIISWESGKTSPTVEMARKYCAFCDVPFDRVSFLCERNAI